MQAELVYPGGANPGGVPGRQTTGVAGRAGEFLEVNGRHALVFGNRRAQMPTHSGCGVIGVGVAHVAALAGIGGNFFRIVRLEVIRRAMWVFRRFDVAATDHVINSVAVAVGTTHS